MALLLCVARECDGALSLSIADRSLRACRTAHTRGQTGTHGYDLSPDCRWAFHTWSTFDSPPVVDLVRAPGLQSQRLLERNEK